MSALARIDDPDAFIRTRHSWHALAEHVLAAARYAGERRIGLHVTPGGFGTPQYERAGSAEALRVAGSDLHVDRSGASATHPITTIAECARAVGIDPGAPADVYPPSTVIDFDAVLTLDAPATSVLATWFDLAWSVLSDLVASAPQNAAASDATLWPEHFDAAIELGDDALGQRGTFGASPGDDEHPEPYLYVTHWADAPDDPYWNDRVFAGASLAYGALLGANDPHAVAIEFFRRGIAVLTEAG